jgi:hypothetical protein
MGFLQQTDYNTFINSQLLNMLLSGNTNKLNDSEDMAEGYIYGKLSALYNIREEFAREGSNRNSTLIRWMLCLSVYYLHNTVADTDIPERVAKNYDDARKEINAVAQGKESTDILPLTVGGKTKTRFRWGSSPKRSHNPYE